VRGEKGTYERGGFHKGDEPVTRRKISKNFVRLAGSAERGKGRKCLERIREKKKRKRKGGGLIS